MHRNKKEDSSSEKESVLVGIINNSKDFLKKYRKHIFSYGFYGYLGLFAATSGLKIQRQVTKNRNEIRSFMQQGYTASFEHKIIERTFDGIKIQYPQINVTDRKTGKIIKKYDNKFSFDILPWALGYLGILLVYESKFNVKKFMRDFMSVGDKITDKTSSIVVPLATYCVMKNITSELDSNHAFYMSLSIAGFATTIAEGWKEKYFYKKALKRTNVADLKFSLPQIVEEIQVRTKKAKSYIKEKDPSTLDERIGYATRETLEAIKLVRNLKPEEQELLTNNLDSFKYERADWERFKSRRSTDYKKHLGLIVNDIISISPFLQSDIKRAIKLCPREELDLRILGAEFTIDTEEAKNKWAYILKLATEKGNIEEISLHTKNTVAKIKSKVLNIYYVFKQEEKSELESEVAQTIKMNEEAFSKIPNIRPLDITVALYFPYIEDEILGIGIFKYIQARHLSEILIEVDDEQRSFLLTEIVKINASTAYHGINDRVVDRRKKTLDEILQLNIPQEEQDKLRNNYDVLFKFTDEFESVYDCDGHSDNRLIKQENGEWVFVTIDNEARSQNDPVYMLVKGLEYKCSIPYTDEGFEQRNELIKLHFDIISQSHDTAIQEAHYYSSVPLKFLSYMLMTKNGKGESYTLETYRKSSIFALDTLLDRYSYMYQAEEIERIQEIKESILAI